MPINFQQIKCDISTAITNAIDVRKKWADDEEEEVGKM